MKLLRWVEKKIKRLSIWDFAVLKIALVVFGIIIGAYIAGFVKSNVTLFAAIFLLLYAYLLMKILKK